MSFPKLKFKMLPVFPVEAEADDGVSLTIINGVYRFTLDAMPANAILGNPTGVSASPGNIGIGTTLAFSGGNLILSPQMFYAHKNGTNQSGFADDVYSKITFGTARYNDGSYYSTADSRWTPPSGRVWLSAQWFVSSGINTGSVSTIKIIKNGATDIAAGLASPTHFVGGDTGVATVCVADTCDGDDYYEAWASIGSASSVSIDGNQFHTFFSGMAF